MNTELNAELKMGLKALARRVLAKNRPLNSRGNPVQSGRVQIEQAGPQDWQEFYDERAAVFEFDGGLPRAEAEAKATEWCVVGWLNRNPVPSEPGRCAWCGKSEGAEGVVVPFGTEGAGQTWLHHGCWAPWHKQRRDEAHKALADVLA